MESGSLNFLKGFPSAYMGGFVSRAISMTTTHTPRKVLNELMNKDQRHSDESSWEKPGGAHTGQSQALSPDPRSP